jgi:hypothetical protein
MERPEPSREENHAPKVGGARHKDPGRRRGGLPPFTRASLAPPAGLLVDERPFAEHRRTQEQRLSGECRLTGPGRPPSQPSAIRISRRSSPALGLQHRPRLHQTSRVSSVWTPSEPCATPEEPPPLCSRSIRTISEIATVARAVRIHPGTAAPARPLPSGRKAAADRLDERRTDWERSTRHDLLAIVW